MNRIVTHSITDDKKGRRMVMGAGDGIGGMKVGKETIMSIANNIDVIMHIVFINLVIQYF